MSDEIPQSDDLRLPDGRVLVHIGPHKTGTTSLQAALYTARPALRAQGVHHAGWGRNPARAVQAVTGQASAYTDAPPPIREWQALVRDVHRARGRRVILSSEFLAHAHEDAVRRVVDDLGRDRVHVVTTLRPLARLIPSMWQQNVKAGRRIGFDPWLHRLFAAPGEQAAEGFWTLHRHDELVARWAAEVGPERVTAVVVDETDREMVLRSFERLLGLQPGTLGLVGGLANRSITAEEAEAIRAYNIAHRKAGLDKATHALAMRYGAAQYIARLEPARGGTSIRLPAWSVEPVGAAARAIAEGIRASGVRVVGDLDSLTALPVDPAPDDLRPPKAVPAEVAARIAMGIVVASGRTRAPGAVPENELATIMPTVATRQLLAAVAARSRQSLGRRRRQGQRAARVAAGRLSGRLRRPARDTRRVDAGGGTDAAAEGARLPAGSIVLHIGPPKTGTTAVQAAFHAARDEVERQGVHYAGRRRHSIAAVQAALGRRGIRSEDVPPVALWHRLRDEILGSGAGRVLLSSEFLADAAPERARALVDELGPERVQVVVTLRPLARIIPSQWQQYVQSGLRLGYGPWLDAVLNRPGTVSPTFWHRHQDAQLVARWAAVVGPERVTVVVVDEADREMILRTFERLLGLRDGTLRLQDELANRSLTTQEIEAVRALNRQFSAAKLGRALHAEIVNFGATEWLKTLPLEPGTTRPELPEWAAPRVAEIAREIIDGIRASGVRVIGDLDRLAAVNAGSGPGPEGEEVPVPVRVAARLALGVLFSSGLARQPAGVFSTGARAAPSAWRSRSRSRGSPPAVSPGSWRRGRGPRSGLDRRRAGDERMTAPVEPVPPGTRLLHIGPPKTGTTSLQGAFWAARDDALEQGVRYAGESRHAVRAMLAITGRRTLDAQRKVPPIRHWERLLEEVRSAPEPRVVISSEGYAYASEAGIAAVIRDLEPARTHVAVTLRPVARLLASQWQQGAQIGLRISYEDWLDRLFHQPDSIQAQSFWHRNRHHELVHRWAAHVGIDRLTVVVVDEADHGWLYRVFEQLTGLRSGTLVPVDRLANRSLTLQEIAAVRALADRYAAEGLPVEAFHGVVRGEIGAYMKLRVPAPGEPRLETPQWVLDAAGEVATVAGAALRASGVRVIGDLDALAAPVRGIAGDRVPGVMVPPEIAARMAMGVVVASGLASRRRQGGPIEPMELARVPTRALGRVVVRRMRRAILRPVRPQG